MCPKCEKARNGDWEGLDELAANAPKHTYLCQCPHCGQLWGGWAFSPQVMYEFTPADAVECFPDWQPSPAK